MSSRKKGMPPSISQSFRMANRTQRKQGRGSIELQAPGQSQQAALRSKTFHVTYEEATQDQEEFVRLKTMDTFTSVESFNISIASDPDIERGVSDAMKFLVGSVASGYRREMREQTLTGQDVKATMNDMLNQIVDGVPMPDVPKEMSHRRGRSVGHSVKQRRASRQEKKAKVMAEDRSDRHSNEMIIKRVNTQKQEKVKKENVGEAFEMVGAFLYGDEKVVFDVVNELADATAIVEGLVGQVVADANEEKRQDRRAHNTIGTYLDCMVVLADVVDQVVQGDIEFEPVTITVQDILEARQFAEEYGRDPDAASVDFDDGEMSLLSSDSGLGYDHHHHRHESAWTDDGSVQSDNPERDRYSEDPYTDFEAGSDSDTEGSLSDASEHSRISAAVLVGRPHDAPPIANIFPEHFSQQEHEMAMQRAHDEGDNAFQNIKVLFGLLDLPSLGAKLLLEEDYRVIDLLDMGKKLKTFVPRSKQRNRLKNWLRLNEEKIRAMESSVGHRIPESLAELLFQLNISEPHVTLLRFQRAKVEMSSLTHLKPKALYGLLSTNRDRQRVEAFIKQNRKALKNVQGSLRAREKQKASLQHPHTLDQFHRWEQKAHAQMARTGVLPFGSRSPADYAIGELEEKEDSYVDQEEFRRYRESQRELRRAQKWEVSLRAVERCHASVEELLFMTGDTLPETATDRATFPHIRDATQHHRNKNYLPDVAEQHEGRRDSVIPVPRAQTTNTETDPNSATTGNKRWATGEMDLLGDTTGLPPAYLAAKSSSRALRKILQSDDPTHAGLVYTNEDSYPRQRMCEVTTCAIM